MTGPLPSLSALPPLGWERTALFLDFDGTLADLAAHPEAVQVPPDLVGVLLALAERLNGALALVSGRRLADLDAFLAPLKLPTAAEHGAWRRRARGDVLSVQPPELSAAQQALQELVNRHSGLLLERKSSALALHYRQAPELEGPCQALMRDLADHTPGAELLQGKCVLELKPAQVSKGRAIAAFMAEPPFAGRTPWFAGDDLTDEAGFDWVQAQGGYTVKVGEGATVAQHHCDSPAQLRAWLAGLLTRDRALAAGENQPQGARA